MATAPKCKICGKAHWRNEPCSLPGTAPKAKAKAKREPKPRPPIAAPYTLADKTPAELIATHDRRSKAVKGGAVLPVLAEPGPGLAAENERLRARVAELEAQLAARKSTDAEYMRAYRARKRAQA